jgi:hypothetical protein
MEKKDLASVITSAETIATAKIRVMRLFDSSMSIPYEYVQRETTNVLLAMIVWKNAEYNGDTKK